MRYINIIVPSYSQYNDARCWCCYKSQSERERLHGHNYSTTVEVVASKGTSLSEGYVMDFGEVKAALKMLCKRWDERFLVPILSPHMEIRAWPSGKREGDEGTISGVDILALGQSGATPAKPLSDDRTAHQISMLVKHDGARFEFPANDCALLPIHHSSAEELARLLCLDLIDELGGAAALQARGMQSIKVALVETPRQEARYCVTFSGDSQHEGTTGAASGAAGSSIEGSKADT